MELAQNPEGMVQARAGGNFVAVVERDSLHSTPEQILV
jgi:hypothetical protein